MTYHLGVDLGTTYTAASIARDGRALPTTLGSRSVAIPSVVYLSGDELLVGEAAARRAVTDPQRVAREFKRRVGDPTPILLGGSPIAAELLMARLLRWVVQQVSATEGSGPASVAVTHPANWGEYKLDLLRQAIRHVDVKVDHFVPEPVAAASFYAAQRDLDAGSVVAVYDLGGGTFDAAVVRAEGNSFRIIGRPDGIERLGGIDFDHAIFRHVADSLGLDLDNLAVDAEDPATVAGLAQLREDCVDAKEALSAETDVSIPVLLPQRHTEVRLTRHEFEAMIRPALNETIVSLRRAVESARVPLDELRAVLLVGGSSRIPLVGLLVTDQLGRPIAVDANPKDAISLGASLLAWRAARPAPPTRDARPAPPAGAAAAAAAAGLGAAAAAAAMNRPGGSSGPAGHPSATPTAPIAARGPAAPSAPAAPTQHSPATPTAPMTHQPRAATPTAPMATPQPAPAAPTGPMVGSGERPAAPPTAPGFAGTPSGGGSGPYAAAPATGAPRPRQDRNLVIAAVALFALVLVLVAVVATRDGGGDDPDPDTTLAQGSETDDSQPDDTQSDDSVPDIGDLPTGSLPDLGSFEIQADDWGEEARTSWGEVCNDMMTAAGAEIGGSESLDYSTMCGCIYDDMSSSGVPFADFNAMLTGENADTSSPAFTAYQDATVNCAFAAIPE